MKATNREKPMTMPVVREISPCKQLRRQEGGSLLQIRGKQSRQMAREGKRGCSHGKRLQKRMESTGRGEERKKPSDLTLGVRVF